MQPGWPPPHGGNQPPHPRAPKAPTWLLVSGVALLLVLLAAKVILWRIEKTRQLDRALAAEAAAAASHAAEQQAEGLRRQTRRAIMVASVTNNTVSGAPLGKPVSLNVRVTNLMASDLDGFSFSVFADSDKLDATRIVGGELTENIGSVYWFRCSTSIAPQKADGCSLWLSPKKRGQHIVRVKVKDLYGPDGENLEDVAAIDVR